MTGVSSKTHYTSIDELATDTKERISKADVSSVIDAYKKTVDVYLENHREYRQIKWVTLFVLVIVFSLQLFIACVFPNEVFLHLMAVLFGLFSFSIVILTMVKNRMYHHYTTRLIIEIENQLSIPHIPLSSDKDKRVAIPRYPLEWLSGGRLWVILTVFYMVLVFCIGIFLILF